MTFGCFPQSAYSSVGLGTRIQKSGDSAGLLAGHVTQLAIFFVENQNRVRIVRVVWLTLKPNGVVLDQALTGFATLGETKCAANGKVRLVQYACARPLRITRSPIFGARGGHRLPLVFTLSRASRLPRLFPLARCHETNVYWKYLFNDEGELIEFLLGHLAVR